MIAPDGTFQEAWGTSGAGDGQFTFFNSNAAFARGYGDVAFDAEGNIYVTDTGDTRVQKFAPDRTFLLSWGSTGPDDGQFRTPSGIAVGANGTVYVSDEGPLRYPAVRCRRAVPGHDRGRREGTRANLFCLPVSPSGPDGDIWVADYGDQRIQRFSGLWGISATPGARAGQAMESFGTPTASR